MVFNLVQAGIFGKTDEDSIADFAGHYDFHDVFVLPFQPGKNRLNDSGDDAVVTQA